MTDYQVQYSIQPRIGGMRCRIVNSMVQVLGTNSPYVYHRKQILKIRYINKNKQKEGNKFCKAQC